MTVSQPAKFNQKDIHKPAVATTEPSNYGSTTHPKRDGSKIKIKPRSGLNNFISTGHRPITEATSTARLIEVVTEREKASAAIEGEVQVRDDLTGWSTVVETETKINHRNDLGVVHDPRIEERRGLVAGYIVRGYSTNDIVAETGYPRATVRDDIEYLMALWALDQKPEEREHWLSLELAKLDRLERTANEVMLDHPNLTLDGLDRILRIMERRHRLLGLDKPTTSFRRLEVLSLENLSITQLERIARGELIAELTDGNDHVQAD